MNLIHLTIDGNTIAVPKGTTVWKAAQDLGIVIPIFCYQDRMPPFGACRVCLVEVEKAGKLQTSCTLEATEGMVVKTQSEMAIKGREGILEFLLINHPLDCPICDRGGECPLQEQALSDGPGKSRFYEEKRHFKKPLSLGPVLELDRERCIICARCTRFGDLIAGDHALEFFDRGFKTEVGTPDGGPAQSKFIGNTIMICPVGALTSDVYRFRARPWDNEPTPSTCTLCPVGCSMVIDARDGEVMRIRSQENQNVNDIWLCDKGWFGYEFSHNQERLQTPLIRKNGQLEKASWDEALSLIARHIQNVKPQGKLAAFGGNPLTVEENHLFQRLMREAMGVNHVDHRIGSLLNSSEEGLPPGMDLPIKACEELSFAVLLGLDLTEEFPVIWLRLRQAINKGAKVSFLGHYAPEIHPHLTQTILHAPGFELETLQKELPRLIESGKQGAIFIGRQYLNNGQRARILDELKKYQIPVNVMEGKDNSMGARFAGMYPELTSTHGLNALQVLQEASQTGWDFLYVAGANPILKFPAKLWEKARSHLKLLVVQDLFLTETAQVADVVLPTLSFIEKGGSFINIEGRVQKLKPGKEIPAGICSDGEIFMMLAEKLQFKLNSDKNFLDALQLGTCVKIPKIEKTMVTPNQVNEKGTLLATFAPALFDHGTRMRHNSHLVQLAKEPCVRLNEKEAQKRGLKDGQTISLRTSDGQIQAKLKIEQLVAEGTVVLPLGFKEVAVHELASQLMNGMAIEI